MTRNVATSKQVQAYLWEASEMGYLATSWLDLQSLVGFGNHYGMAEHRKGRSEE
jgi:hypothetical protein